MPRARHYKCFDGMRKRDRSQQCQTVGARGNDEQSSERRWGCGPEKGQEQGRLERCSDGQDLVPEQHEGRGRLTLWFLAWFLGG